MKSKSYGLGKDMLWSLNAHSVIRDLGFKPPHSDVHTFKYEHEKECADIFVSLVQTLYITDWRQHSKVSTGIIPDRTAELEDLTLYIENERGTQGIQKLEKKLLAYKHYWRETNEAFQVLFVVKDTDHITELYQRLNLPYHAVLFEDLFNLSDAKIHSLRGVEPFLSAFHSQLKSTVSE